MKPSRITSPLGAPIGTSLHRRPLAIARWTGSLSHARLARRATSSARREIPSAAACAHAKFSIPSCVARSTACRTAWTARPTDVPPRPRLNRAASGSVLGSSLVASAARDVAVTNGTPPAPSKVARRFSTHASSSAITCSTVAKGLAVGATRGSSSIGSISRTSPTIEASVSAKATAGISGLAPTL